MEDLEEELVALMAAEVAVAIAEVAVAIIRDQVEEAGLIQMQTSPI
jgi:hypothetical protein